MSRKPQHPNKKVRLWRWLGAGSLVVLLSLALLSNLVAAGLAQAQTEPTTEPAGHETTTAVVTEHSTVEATPHPTSETTAAATTTAAHETTAATEGAVNLAPGVVDNGDAKDPQNVEETCVNGKELSTKVVDDGLGDASLCADQIAQLKDLAAGSLSPELVAQIKKLASDKIAEYGPSLIDKLDDKANAKQDQRIIWIAIILVGVLPLLTFLLFIIYPLVRRKKIQEKAPGATTGKIYGLYLPQALLVTLVMILLGGALTGIQFLTGRILGGVTNPQLVMQREAINYVIDQRDYLIDNYSNIFVGVADDILNNEDPDKSMMDIILSNALQLKDNPVVNTAVSVVRFVMPFLSYLSIVALAILVLFFLLRVRPEITALLVYPEAILAAQYTNTPLPPLKSVALGDVPVSSPSSAEMRKVGQKLMFNEIKVLALFAVGVLIVAVAMSFVLSLFFYSISELLVDSISDAIEYFLGVDGAANTLLICVIILMVFVVETVALFLLSFTFFLGKVQDGLRQRFAKRITWKQTWQYVGRQALRFGWILVLAAIFGFGAPYGANAVSNWLYNGDKDPNWTVALLVVPVGLLVILNLGFWLLRGFKMFVKMFKTSAAVEFGLVPPKPQKPNKKEAVAAS